MDKVHYQKAYILQQRWVDKKLFCYSMGNTGQKLTKHYIELKSGVDKIIKQTLII